MLQSRVFSDLKEDNQQSKSVEQQKGICATEECKSCSDQLLNRLQSVGVTQPKEIEKIRQRFSLQNRPKNQECSKYNVKLDSSRSASTVPLPQNDGSAIRNWNQLRFSTARNNEYINMINNLTIKGNENWMHENRSIRSTNRRMIRDSAVAVGNRIVAFNYLSFSYRNIFKENDLQLDV